MLTFKFASATYVIGPGSGHQIRLLDRFAWALDQGGQKIERSAAETNGGLVTQQKLSLRDEKMQSKREAPEMAHGDLRSGFSFVCDSKEMSVKVASRKGFLLGARTGSMRGASTLFPESTRGVLVRAD